MTEQKILEHSSGSNFPGIGAKLVDFKSGVPMVVWVLKPQSELCHGVWSPPGAFTSAGMKWRHFRVCRGDLLLTFSVECSVRWSLNPQSKMAFVALSRSRGSSPGAVSSFPTGMLIHSGKFWNRSGYLMGSWPFKGFTLWG